MKKIVSIISFIIIWISIINIFDFYYFINNNNWIKLYNNKEYNEAINNFKINNHKISEYNIANSLYKQEKYRDALQKYNILSTENFSPLQFKTLHNIWNTIYKIWENEKNSELKIKYLTESIENYSKALEIKFDEETKANLEFIQNKIKQERKKQQKQEEEKQNQDNSENWENSKKEETKNKKSQKWKTDENMRNICL